MTNKNHSQTLVGSRHAIHNLTYPNAANRIAGTNEGKSIVVDATNLWQVAKQDDDDSYWFLSGVAPLTWVQIATAVTADLDFGYDAFGGAGLVTIDAGDLTWDLLGGFDFVVDADTSGSAFSVNATSLGQELDVYNSGGTELRLWFQGGSFDIDLSNATNNATATFEGDFFVADQQKGFFLWGLTNSEVMATGATATLLLGARGDSIYLNEAGATSLDGAFSAVSIVGALNELVAGPGILTDLNEAYDHFGANPSTITVDAAEGQTGGLTFALDGVRDLNVDLTSSDDPLGGEGGTYYGLYVNNGTDNFQVVRAAANQVDVRGTLNDIILGCSGRVEYNVAENLEIELTQDSASSNFVGIINNGSSGLNAASGTQNWLDLVPRIEQSGTASYNAIRVDLTEVSTGSGDTNLLNLIVGGSTQFQVASDGNTQIGTGTPGVATGAGDLYVTNNAEAQTLDLVKAGTIKANTDFLTLTNTANAADMDGTGTGILWNQWYYDGVTPAIADAGRITMVADRDWTSTTSTQDAHMRFDTVLDGAVAEKMRLTSDGVLGNISSHGSVMWRSTNQTPDSPLLLTGTVSNSWILCEYADRNFDFAHALATDPKFIIHSANQSITEYGEFYHDQTHFRAVTGAGAFCVGTGTPGTATGAGDAYITGKLEVDDILQVDSTGVNLNLSSDISSGNFLGSNGPGKMTASSGVQSWLNIQPEINQTGTAAYNGLLVDVTETGTGSGLKNLIRLLRGGVDRFRVDSAGTISTRSSTSDGSTNLIDLRDGALVTQFVINSDGNTKIGTGVPGTATGAGDAYITGKLEVDQSIYADSNIILAGNKYLGAVATNYGCFFTALTNQANDSLAISTGTSANLLLICEYADAIAFDFAHAVATDPTLFIHSANQSITEYLGLYHDQTDAVFASGAGALSLQPASGVIKYPDAGQTLYDIAPASDHTATGDTVSATVDTNATGIGAALYQAADGNWDEADADALATMPCRALALEAGTGTKLILRRGWIRDDSWSWTPGAPVYASTTTGALTQTKPSGTGDQVQIVGYAETATVLDFNPSTVIVEVA